MCPLGKLLYTPLSTGSTQEDRKLSRYDRKIVDWDINYEHKNKAQMFFYWLNLFQVEAVFEKENIEEKEESAWSSKFQSFLNDRL